MRVRNIIISIFVVGWLVVFHYESTRHFYWEPLLGRPLPKMKFLFPPAGWIMFFNVDDSYGYTEVYGVKDGHPQMIDPHQILQTRAIGYDNINRNALVTVLSRDVSGPFCLFLHRKFPYFDSFLVTYVNYPSLTKRPFERLQAVAYECK
ncbi:MAG: hypothetical protein HY209_03965 [Candidatus Omnitrophica bacterium]|nr:hypothetical protein [Candidatus Omnitrophota bacterium]